MKKESITLEEKEEKIKNWTEKRDALKPNLKRLIRETRNAEDLYHEVSNEMLEVKKNYDFFDRLIANMIKYKVLKRNQSNRKKVETKIDLTKVFDRMNKEDQKKFIEGITNNNSKTT